MTIELNSEQKMHDHILGNLEIDDDDNDDDNNNNNDDDKFSEILNKITNSDFKICRKYKQVSKC